MAPNATLFDVKVLDDSGNGQMSDTLAGIDWVLFHARQYNIRVMNISVAAASTESTGSPSAIMAQPAPAGTGIARYRNIAVQPTEEARAAAYTIPSYEDQYYSPDFGQATGAAVPLDDYGYSDYR